MGAPQLLDYVGNAIYLHLLRFKGRDPSIESQLFDESTFVSHEWQTLYPMALPSTSPITYFHTSEILLRIKFPTREEVRDFLLGFVNRAAVTHECIIILLIYVERLLEGGVMLMSFNWKPVLLAALLVSAKMWEDKCRWNVEFVRVVPEYTVMAINQLETEFCRFLDFRFHINGADYARYYFRLRMEQQSPVALSYTKLRMQSYSAKSSEVGSILHQVSETASQNASRSPSLSVERQWVGNEDRMQASTSDVISEVGHPEEREPRQTRP